KNITCPPDFSLDSRSVEIKRLVGYESEFGSRHKLTMGLSSGGNCSMYCSMFRCWSLLSLGRSMSRASKLDKHKKIRSRSVMRSRIDLLDGWSILCFSE